MYRTIILFCFCLSSLLAEDGFFKKKCISTCIFMPKKKKINIKYRNTYLSLPKSMEKLGLDSELDLVIYHDSTVPDYMLKNLKKYSFVKLIRKPFSKGRDGCFWRYEAYDNYDFCYFRDIDYHLQEENVLIMRDFLSKKNNVGWVYLIHRRSDYPKQGFVMGGDFMIKKCNSIPSMVNLLRQWKMKQSYGDDERFLAKIVYKKMQSPICYCTDKILPFVESKSVLDEDYFLIKYSYRLQK